MLPIKFLLSKHWPQMKHFVSFWCHCFKYFNLILSVNLFFRAVQKFVPHIQILLSRFPWWVINNLQIEVPFVRKSSHQFSIFKQNFEWSFWSFQNRDQSLLEWTLYTEDSSDNEPNSLCIIVHICKSNYYYSDTQDQLYFFLC